MDKFIHFEYNEEPFPSIDDDKSDGILSLETALESVLSQIDHLDQFINKAKKHRHHPSEYGLTEDESTAVYLYTDECNGQSLHRILNQALQSGDRTMIKPWLGFLKLFNNALEKLPTVKDTIWRVLSTDIAKQLKDNEEVVCWSMISCSTSTEIINNILDEKSVLCSIKPLNGKDIHAYSASDNEQEVLLLPGTRLRVKHEEPTNGKQKSVIYLEEISDVSGKQIQSNDVTMVSADESANDEDIKDNDHLKMKPSTPTNEMSNESHPSNKNLTKNGTKAQITFSNGARYKLTYQNGKKQGYGKYFSMDGNVVEGEDADNKATGEGICAFRNGDRFIGRFERGTRHGHGILYNMNGPIEAGDWTNDELNAQSLKIMSNGDHYEWKDESGAERRYGAYLDDNGNKYIGNVVDNKAEGLGIRIWSDSNQYEGDFKNDKKYGYGIYRYSGSAIYKGQWTDDEISGDGKFVWNSGTKYRGQLINGKRHGQGKVTFSNGKIQEGNWQNDEYVQLNTVSSSSSQ